MRHGFSEGYMMFIVYLTKVVINKNYNMKINSSSYLQKKMYLDTFLTMILDVDDIRFMDFCFVGHV